METVETVYDFLSLDGQSGDFKVTDDIDFGGYTIEEAESVSFSGNLYGQGHTFKNLTVSIADIDLLPQDAGLFTSLSGGVYNLMLDNITVNASFDANPEARDMTYAGAVAGNAPGAELVNVHVRNSSVRSYSTNYVTGTATFLGIGIAGGLLGIGGTVRGCSVKNTTISGMSSVGGLVGDGSNVNISDSYGVENAVEIIYGPEGDDIYDPQWNAAGIGVASRGFSDFNVDRTFVSNTFSGSSQYGTYAGLAISVGQNDEGEVNAYFNNSHGYEAFKHLSDIGSGIGGDGVGLSPSQMKGTDARDNMDTLNFGDIFRARTEDFPQLITSFSRSSQVFVSGEPMVLLPESDSLAEALPPGETPANFITQEGVPVTTSKESIPYRISTDYPDEPL